MTDTDTGMDEETTGTLVLGALLVGALHALADEHDRRRAAVDGES